MRILHVIDSLRLGGAERMLVDLANAAASDNHAVFACVTRNGLDLAPELNPSIPLWVLDRKRRFDWDSARRLAGLLRQNCIELIHAHGRSTFALLAFMKMVRLVRVPVLLHDHFGKIEVDTSIPLWFRLWGRWHLHHYVGVHEKLADWARRAGVPPRRISTIGNVLNLDRLQQATPLDLKAKFGWQTKTRVGIAVAGIRWEKGIEVLIDAIARLQHRHSVAMVIVGEERDPAYSSLCRDRVRAAGLNEMVRFAGGQNNVPEWIKGADFAVVPSLSESGPLVLIEFMACGLPFVATRVGEISHHVRQLGGRHFIEPKDVQALVAGIDEILRLRPSDLQERRQRGMEIALKHFHVRAAMFRWYRAYDLAIGQVLP